MFDTRLAVFARGGLLVFQGVLVFCDVALTVCVDGLAVSTDGRAVFGCRLEDGFPACGCAERL